MNKILVLRITILLAFFCTELAVQENPFLKMAGKPYSEYYEELGEAAYRHSAPRNLLYMKQITIQIRETAKMTKDKKWLLEADYCEIIDHYLRVYYNGNLSQNQKDSLSETHVC